MRGAESKYSPLRQSEYDGEDGISHSDMARFDVSTRHPLSMVIDEEHIS